MDTLFDNSDLSSKREPLAKRMCARNLDEYVGQEHIIAPGKLLRRCIVADRLSSAIFYGPPGVGKTTLAQVIAAHTKSSFITLNAVLSGVADIRKAIKDAQDAFSLYSRRTILFVDEVHRWSKSQQDALLPFVENGTVILIGATTQNPFYEVNRALVSRSRVFELHPLSRENLFSIANRAVSDKERGYGDFDVKFDEGALAHLVDSSSGDARSLLNALELAIETTPTQWPPQPGTAIHITMEIAQESIQKKVLLYDKDGDYHYDVVSAFIKSVRGRDVDAAIYYLARMVAAGEDPYFIFRRLLISACEDTGMAAPFAITIIESCERAFERVGFPEGQYFLAHATIYLATAPKSNSSQGFFDALHEIESLEASQKIDVGNADVPDPIKDPTRVKIDRRNEKTGKFYKYPHDFADHWVAQQYLPNTLIGRQFYHPTTQGYEAKIKAEVEKRRKDQADGLKNNS